MDTRSFGLNDEVNVAVCDAAFTARLEQNFADDLAHSRRIDYEQWKHRGVRERVGEWLGSLFERQE
jgi:cardiolipin synthase